MYTRPNDFDFLNEFPEKLQVHFGMNATNYMYFSNRDAIVFANHVEHLLFGKFPGIFNLLKVASISAKLAVKNTFIGGLDVKVAVEISDIAMPLLANEIGNSA